MEKVRPWCGQPSDRGRLRNRTEMSGYDCLNKKRFNSRRKVDGEFAATTSIVSVFQMRGATTAKARLPAVDSLTVGTARRLALVERSVRRPGRSSTLLSGPR